MLSTVSKLGFSPLFCRQSSNSFSHQPNRNPTSAPEQHKHHTHNIHHENAGHFVYIPHLQKTELATDEQLEKEAHNIYEWAKSRGAERYSFIAYPHTSGICEKQESFLSIRDFANRTSFK